MTRWTMMLLLMLPACQRKLCSLAGAQENRTMPAFWSAKKDLLPDGTVVCSSTSAPTYQSLEVDFDPEPKMASMVTVAQHLESKGWVRMSQNHTDTTWEMDMRNEKVPDTQLVVRGITGGGRTSVSYVWGKAPKQD